MIAGLDSSFSRPTPAIAAQARAAGVGLWSGYLATKGGVNLASPWDLASFDVARQVGGTPIAFCSGLDDPVACRNLAGQWNVRLCLDVESGIRADGSWVQPFLDLSGAGLYGQHYQDTSGVWHSIHLNRTAAFHVMSWYIGRDPGASWAGPTPADGSPLGWQWQGGHTEFGLDVDRGTYDDWFAGAFAGGSISRQAPGGKMFHPTIPGRFDDFIVGTDSKVYHLFGTDPAHPAVESWGGVALPGSAEWGWSPDGLHLLVRVVNSAGQLWYRQVNVSGAVELDWTQAVGQTAGLPAVAPNTDAALRAYLKAGPA